MPSAASSLSSSPSSAAFIPPSYRQEPVLRISTQCLLQFPAFMFALKLDGTILDANWFACKELRYVCVMVCCVLVCCVLCEWCTVVLLCVCVESGRQCARSSRVKIRICVDAIMCVYVV